ncbi:MAG: hypothetical protein EPN94_04900 [Nitrospirae bacterium]|nr:MAG: hypothetical protein EPN94_04900 [Nitrospirota bacterium]
MIESMDKKELEATLCLNYCPYYKPFKDEGLACNGFTIVERLMARGRDIPFGSPAGDVSSDTKKALVRDICNACPFYIRDCDFTAGKEDTQPCGGFSFLGHLLDAKIITLDDMHNINYTLFK